MTSVYVKQSGDEVLMKMNGKTYELMAGHDGYLDYKGASANYFYIGGGYALEWDNNTDTLSLYTCTEDDEERYKRGKKVKAVFTVDGEFC
jgi:hypothetical protein